MSSKTLIGIPGLNMKKVFIGMVLVSSISLLLFFSFNQGPQTPNIQSKPVSFLSNHTAEAVYEHYEDIEHRDGNDGLHSPAGLHENRDGNDGLHSPAALHENIIETLLALDGSSKSSKIVSVWGQFKLLMLRSDLSSEVRNAMKEASEAWKVLMQSVAESSNVSKVLEKQCPYSVTSSNFTDVTNGGFFLEIPCGMVLDSAITLVGVPHGGLSEFRVDLVGTKNPGESEPPIILHYNIRLKGDKLTEDPVIVQNTWTSSQDWADEERCPRQEPDPVEKVDGLDVCIEQIGKMGATSGKDNGTVKWPGVISSRAKPKHWFPYTEGLPFASTLWAGWEGFHTTVDGRHTTSFQYRQSLEPWLVNGARISGSLELSSIIVNGLPTSEELHNVPDMELLKAPILAESAQMEMFIGVFSTANNFDRRMAVRRSWMQYPAVRSGNITVRFFVGLHTNQQVNKELWNEAVSYGDIQLLPFVDYYNLITLKTLAICIYATKNIRTDYVMKTDDDTFVRVDEVLSLVKSTKRKKGLLYGRIEENSKPHRDKNSKWYIKEEEWPSSTYPPWAAGPGYIISTDIAKFVVQENKKGRLKLFKLEDVAMGIWVQSYQKKFKDISYRNDNRFFTIGCKQDYAIAHYQNPRQMGCLWHQLQTGAGPVCCK